MQPPGPHPATPSTGRAAPRCTLPLFLFVALVLAPLRSLPAQQIELQPYRPQEEIAQDPGAARAFSIFSQAWSERDAGRIAEFVPEDGRASVTIESRGVSSQLGRGQMEALLSGLFSEAERAAFDLSPIHLSNETSAYAVGDWIYEPRGAGHRQRDKVFVVLRQSVPRNWILSELRVSPAR
jgi:hypothetical protein